MLARLRELTDLPIFVNLEDEDTIIEIPLLDNHMTKLNYFVITRNIRVYI